MQLTLDPHDRGTLYADLREGEALTDDLRARALRRAGELGAQHVEFWQPPYGRAADRMQGFVELARVASVRDTTNDLRERADGSASARRTRF